MSTYEIFRKNKSNEKEYLNLSNSLYSNNNDNDNMKNQLLQANNLIQTLEFSNHEIQEKIYSIKSIRQEYEQKLKEKDKLIKKLSYDNAQLTYVNDKLLEELNKIKKTNKEKEQSEIVSFFKDEITARTKENNEYKEIISNLKQEINDLKMINKPTTNILSNDSARMEKFIISLYNFYDHICHLFKKNRKTFDEWINSDENIDSITQNLEDEIKLLFIQKNYATETNEENLDNTNKVNDGNNTNTYSNEFLNKTF